MDRHLCKMNKENILGQPNNPSVGLIYFIQ